MFTNYFIKKKIQALVSDAAKRPHRSLSLDEARSLLVLYNIEDHEDVMRALEPLRKAKKDIKTCVYVPSGGADSPFDDSNIPVHIKTELKQVLRLFETPFGIGTHRPHTPDCLPEEASS